MSDQQPLNDILTTARTSNQSIVLTNGCFDVLHPGHIKVLSAAAAEGDVLVVGVNSDSGVRTLKGSGHPVFPLADRLAMVSAIRWVHCATVFNQLTADRLIRQVRPDVYVKGADYDSDSGGQQLPEAETLADIGARVVFTPLLPGRSSTNVIDHLRLMK